MAGPIRISILADTRDLQQNLSRAEDSMIDAERTAERTGRDIESSFDGVGASADGLASTSSQVAGGLGDLGGALSALPGPLGGIGTGMEALSPAIMGVTGAADLANAAIEKMRLGTVAAKAATIAKAAADKAAAAAQWALNVAMSANPLGLVLIAIVALVAGLVIAYKKSETFRRIVDAAFAKVKDAAGAVADFFTKKVPPAFQAIMDKAGAAKDWITRKFNEVVTFVTGLPGRIRTAAGNLFGAIQDKANAVVGTYSAAGGGVRGKLFDLVDFIGGLPGKVANKARGMFDGIANTATASFNKVIDAWNAIDFSISVSIPSWVPGVGGRKFSVPDVIPDIPRLASGGITTGPTLAWIGDNPGGREAVIPLDKYDLGGSTTNVYMTGTFVGQSKAEFGRWVVSALDEYESQGGRRRG